MDLQRTGAQGRIDEGDALAFPLATPQIGKYWHHRIAHQLNKAVVGDWITKRSRQMLHYLLDVLALESGAIQIAEDLSDFSIAAASRSLQTLAI
jgi:hypothetical protein